MNRREVVSGIIVAFAGAAFGITPKLLRDRIESDIRSSHEAMPDLREQEVAIGSPYRAALMDLTNGIDFDNVQRFEFALTARGFFEAEIPFAINRPMKVQGVAVSKIGGGEMHFHSFGGFKDTYHVVPGDRIHVVLAVSAIRLT